MMSGGQKREGRFAFTYCIMQKVDSRIRAESDSLILKCCVAYINEFINYKRTMTVLHHILSSSDIYKKAAFCLSLIKVSNVSIIHPLKG